MDHALLSEYRVFVNPSLSEVLCTTIVEVRACNFLNECESSIIIVVIAVIVVIIIKNFFIDSNSLRVCG